jgi:hypothetical protein
MMDGTTKPKWTLLVIGAIAGVAASWCCLSAVFNPARQSEKAIEEELLQATPLGSSVGEVDLYVKTRFARHHFHWYEPKDDKRLVLSYGCYNTLQEFPWATCVRATWLFDKNGKLIDIGVFKWIDCP